MTIHPPPFDLLLSNKTPATTPLPNNKIIAVPIISAINADIIISQLDFYSVRKIYKHPEKHLYRQKLEANASGAYLPLSKRRRSDVQMLPPSVFLNFPMLMLAVVHTPWILPTISALGTRTGSPGIQSQGNDSCGLFRT